MVRICSPLTLSLPNESKAFPRYFIDIAEHSICQPGRPLPKLAFQLGFPSFAAFHKTKSSALSLLYSSTLTLAPVLSSRDFRPERRPYFLNLEISK